MGKWKFETGFLQNLYNEGFTVAEVANKLGVPVPTMGWIFRRQGIKIRSRRERINLAKSQGRTARKAGSDSPSWRGGRQKDKYGYILVYAPGYYQGKRTLYVREHILVWEKAHSRKVPKGWVIHHINGKKDDNRPKNLFALPRKSHRINLQLEATQKRVRAVEAEIRKLRAQRRLSEVSV